MHLIRNQRCRMMLERGFLQLFSTQVLLTPVSDILDAWSLVSSSTPVSRKSKDKSWALWERHAFPGIQEPEAGGSQMEELPGLQREFKASLGKLVRQSISMEGQRGLELRTAQQESISLGCTKPRFNLKYHPSLHLEQKLTERLTEESRTKGLSCLLHLLPEVPQITAKRDTPPPQACVFFSKGKEEHCE